MLTTNSQGMLNSLAILTICSRKYLVVVLWELLGCLCALALDRVDPFQNRICPGLCQREATAIFRQQRGHYRFRNTNCGCYSQLVVLINTPPDALTACSRRCHCTRVSMSAKGSIDCKPTGRLRTPHNMRKAQQLLDS